MILFVLVALRYGLHIVLVRSGLPVTLKVQNDFFIAMAVGVLVGRAGYVFLHALALVGWNINALPGRPRA